ncbi:hypothetical protein Tco_0699584 [Tanacetum coccineum]
MIEPNEEDEIWRNQQDWNFINWKLHNFYGVHVLLMDTSFVNHMMVEKKYPLSHDTLSKMLSRRLEVDHQSEIGYKLIRQDVMELYRLVNERFQTASPEGYDLLLWGDLKTMIKPNEEDEYRES